MQDDSRRSLAICSVAVLLLVGQACEAPLSEDVDGGQEQTEEPAVAPAEGQLLIEEIYYSGAAPNGGADHYFSDQFIELVNASDVPLDLSGILIGDASGVAGALNPGTVPNSYVESHPTQVVLESVWRIPNDVRLEPGEHFVLAHDGTNHRPFSTIDLSGAHFEAFVQGSGRDLDHPTVPNAESLLFGGGFDWLVPVFGASFVVIESDAPAEVVNGPFGDLFAYAENDVLDAVDALMDADSGAFKRLPSSIDRGFASVSGTYVGESLHRVRTEDGWQDTNDSTVDFVRGVPTPSERLTDIDAESGDQWLELGTGTLAFTPLSDGDGIELVAGFQGGWHLDAGLRFGGFRPSGVTLFYEALNTDGESVSFVTSAQLSPSGVIVEDGGFVRLGDRVVLDVDDGATMVGETLVLRIIAEGDGATLTDAIELIVIDAID